jgi:DNA (cytosine-5)-methyltransferase 1
MENVLKAPEPEPEGYNVVSFILNNCWLGEAQRRKRRFWYGTRGETPNLRRWIPGAALELAESELAVCGNDGRMPDDRRRVKKAPVTGRHDGAVGSPQKSYEPERRTLADMLELQGLPRDWFDHQPWTVSAKRKMIGNGVPVPMGRAIAGAIRKALAS